MPTGQKHKPYEKFDISDSEIVAWLTAQPTIQQYLFDKFRFSGAIIFDTETETWRGRDVKSVSEGVLRLN